MQEVELVIVVSGSILAADSTQLSWMLDGPVREELMSETQAVLDAFTDSHGVHLWRVGNVTQYIDPESLKRVNDSHCDVEVTLHLECKKSSHPVRGINHLSLALKTAIGLILLNYFRGKSFRLAIDLKLRVLEVSHRTYSVGE